MTASLFSLPLNLTPEEAYPYLGISKNPISLELSGLINHYLLLVRQTASPAAVHQTYDVHSSPAETEICLDGAPLVLEGPATIRHFSTSSRVTLIAATLGPSVDGLLSDLGKRLPSHALICDGIASAAAEHLVEQLDLLVSREIRRKGFFPTARYSPGYGDWPLMRQRDFLDSVEANKIGLTLSPHFLLQPVKSVTAAIGWSTVPLAREYETCTQEAPCHGASSCVNCPLSGSCAFSKK